MSDRSEALIVRYEPEHGPPRRQVFEPLSSGGYERIDEVYAGGQWDFVGSEPVTELAIDGDSDQLSR